MIEQEIRDYLIDNKESKYRDFIAKLVPGAEDILGVRMPILKNLVKTISKGEYIPYLEQQNFQYHEERMLYGLVLGSIKNNFATTLHYLKLFVPMINNWSICDSLCSSLKETKKHKQELLPYILECCNSEEDYTIRFGVVMLMNYYCDDEHIELIFTEYSRITNREYYVSMAVAWGVATCYNKYQDATINYLKGNNLDKWTHNKAIQKIVESLQVTPEDKSYIKTLKQ